MPFANPVRMMLPKLGIIAGGGDLPREIIAECRRSGRPFYVVALKGQADTETVKDTPHTWIRLGAAGKTIKTFRQQNAIELVMAGSVTRPSLAQLRPDFWALKFFASSRVHNKGDDGLLRAVIVALESHEGFRVVGAHAILPDLLATEGSYGNVSPDRQALQDINIAWEAAYELGAQDIGQAAVARNGALIAKESASGTAVMLSGITALDAHRPAGVLVKVSKPDQEYRADLPAIGPDTIDQAVKAGLAGIAIEAGKALILNKVQTIKAANDAQLFIVGISQQPGKP